MEAGILLPKKKYTIFAVSRPQGYPPEWVRLGPLTVLENTHITGHFTSTPTSHWGWEWLAVPEGEDPPPLPQESPPKRPAQPSQPVQAKPVRVSQPLPGEEEPEGFFGVGDDNR